MERPPTRGNMHTVASDARVKVLYITGVTRSGSGILGRLLSTIPGTVFAGELRRVWSRGFRPGRTCACGRPHTDCPLWSKILTPGSCLSEPTRSSVAATQRRVAPDRLDWWVALRHVRLTSEPARDSPEGRYMAAYTDLHLAVAQASGAELVIDSSKHASDAALLTLRRRPPTFLIHLIRDPRAVVSRLQAHSERRSAAARSALAVRGAIRWSGKHLVNELIRRRLAPDRATVLRYEDLVQDPGAVVDSVARLTGLPRPPERLAPGVPIQVPEAHGPDGSRRRRHETLEVIVENDTRWRRDLTGFDRRLVTLLTYPLLRRYGYPTHG